MEAQGPTKKLELYLGTDCRRHLHRRFFLASSPKQHALAWHSSIVSSKCALDQFQVSIKFDDPNSSYEILSAFRITCLALVSGRISANAMVFWTSNFIAALTAY